MPVQIILLRIGVPRYGLAFSKLDSLTIAIVITECSTLIDLCQTKLSYS